MRSIASVGLAAAMTLTTSLPVQAGSQTARHTPGDTAYRAFIQPVPVALAGGRQIALHCAGRGGPTVVLIAGAGDWSDTWRMVVRPLAKRRRVCAADRAGFGFSGASAEPQDVLHTEADLEAALRAGGVAPPYLLVSHSLGSYEALLFADRRRADIAGMVLIDPSFPDQDRVVRESNPEAGAFLDKSLADMEAGARRCAADLRSGRLKPGQAQPETCLTAAAPLAPALKRRLAVLNADPARAETRASFADEIGRDSTLVIRPGRNYGGLPLVVLTAGNEPARLSAFPDSVKAFLNRQWVAGHDALAALSGAGVNRRVPGTTHYIHLQKPGVVIAAVDDVAARASSRSGKN